MEPIYFSWRQAVLKSKLGATTKHVLMTLGCHMNEMGESCFPSIELLCEETSLSNRAVITNLRLSKDAGFITTTKHGFAGKKWARNEYKATFPPIDNSTKAVNEVHYQDDEAVNLIPEGSEPNDIKAVNEVHTSTSINSPYNKSNPRAHEPEKTDSTKPPTEKPAMTPEGELACWLIPQKVKVQSINPTLCAWVKDGFTKQHIAECLAIARQHKPLPEIIPANYLDRIIREKPRPQKTQDAWWLSDKATEAKANELGMQIKRGESWGDLRNRMRQVRQRLCRPAPPAVPR